MLKISLILGLLILACSSTYCEGEECENDALP